MNGLKRIDADPLNPRGVNVQARMAQKRKYVRYIYNTVT